MQMHVHWICIKQAWRNRLNTARLHRAQYGSIRTALEAVGKPIRPNDLLFAAHTLTLGAVLVTANVAEFARVAALQLENWLD